MGQDVMNLDSFKGAKPAQAFAQTLNASQDNLADGIGSSYGVIGYKGKVWSLRLRGERHTFVRPDDGTPASYIDVIILRSASHKSKSYYEKYDPNASEGARPICSSLDGIVPDDDVAVKQSDACAICPRNAWKVNAEGRKGRECTDYKRLAVLVVPSMTKTLLGTALMEPVFLRIPPASLNDLAIVGETMAGQGWHYSSYVTRISFDPDQPHPKMVFRPLQKLTDDEAPVVLPMREDAMALRITGEDQAGASARPMRLAAAPQTAPQLAAPQVAQPAPQPAPQPQPQPQPAPQPAPQPVIEATAIDVTPQKGGMFAGADTPAAPPAKLAGGNVAAGVVKEATTPVTQTAQDTGEATESDAALDDKIAALLKTE